MVLPEEQSPEQLLVLARGQLRIALVFLFVGPILALMVGGWALLTVANTLGVQAGFAVAMAVGACAGLPGVMAGRRALRALGEVGMEPTEGAPYRRPGDSSDEAAKAAALRAKARGHAHKAVWAGVVAGVVGAVLPVLALLFLAAGMGAPGRPFRRRGRAALPDTRPDGSWCDRTPTVPDTLDAGERARRARRWLDDARAEHASIASFCEVTLALLSLGAPPALVEQSLRAATDEVAHARLAFELASAFAGRPVSAGALREASAGDALARLRPAAESLVDGQLNEGLAAHKARAAAAAADNPAERSALERIASDEARHAALGKSLAAWALG